MNAAEEINNRSLSEEENFEALMKKYEGLIVYLSKKYDIFNRMEVEDILQEGCLVLWDALNKYEPEKSSFDSYLTLRLEKHFLNIRKYLCRKKNRGYTVSIEKELVTGEGLCLKDIMADTKTKNIFEDIYFEDYINSMLNNYRLTDTEYLVLKNVICLREMGYYRVAPILNRYYGFNKKTIDNALTRIKKKVPVKNLLGI